MCTDNLQLGPQRGVTQGKMPVCAGQKTKGNDKRGKYDEEDNVGAQGADEVDETEQAHE